VVEPCTVMSVYPCTITRTKQCRGIVQGKRGKSRRGIGGEEFVSKYITCTWCRGHWTLASFKSSLFSFAFWRENSETNGTHLIFHLYLVWMILVSWFLFQVPNTFLESCGFINVFLLARKTSQSGTILQYNFADLRLLYC
jgi:hypothetical protein